MFNINDAKYNKVTPTIERLYEEVTDYEIFRYYIGEFKVGEVFNSPLRQDINPSFAIFAAKNAPGRLFFKDHCGESGDCIKYVRLLYNCSYKEALERVITDFKLTDKFFVDSHLDPLKPVTYRLDKESRIEFEASKLDLKITRRDWNNKDLIYWKNQGISKDTLDIFRVIPIKYYWMYNILHNADDYAYAYQEWKDDELNYKVYQPFRDSKNHKFLNGFLDGTFSGWDLLPKYTDLIIITKSTKDAMFLFERGYYAVNPQGEGYTFKPQVIQQLKDKCKKLVLFYDHDKAGLKAAKERSEEYNIDFVTTNDFDNKDITDFYKSYGQTETLNLLNKILN
jgi:DNA primase